MGVLWARLGLWLFKSPLHSPGLLLPHDEQPADAPFVITGVVNGSKLTREYAGGAKARTVFVSLVSQKPQGWLEFRHDGVVRSRYSREG